MGYENIDEFSTDTGKLWYGGNQLLPSAADEYADISSRVWMTRDTADNVFAAGKSPTDNMSQVYEAWNALRTDFQNILAETSTNLNGAGAALMSLANTIAETDGAGATEIENAGEALPEIHVSDPKSSDEDDPDYTDSHETVPGQPQI